VIAARRRARRETTLRPANQRPPAKLLPVEFQGNWTRDTDLVTFYPGAMSRLRSTKFGLCDLSWHGEQLSAQGGRFSEWRTLARIIPDYDNDQSVIHLADGRKVRVAFAAARSTAQRLALEMLNAEQPRRKSA
jgi:hypothetical protein